MFTDCQSLLEVRPAEYSDIPQIMEITREAFLKYKQASGAENLEALSETVTDIKHDIETKIVLVALLDGEPVGSVRIEVFPDGTAYLTRFGVRVGSQNNGIGKSIINLVDKIIRKRGVKKIYLYTGSKVSALMRFYYGRGFYVESVDNSRGYLRAKLVKDYI